MTLDLLVTRILNRNNPGKRETKRIAHSPGLYTAVSSSCEPSPCPISPHQSFQISALAASSGSNWFQEGPWGTVGRHMPSLVSLSPWRAGQSSWASLVPFGFQKPCLYQLWPPLHGECPGLFSLSAGLWVLGMVPHLQGLLLSLMSELGGCREVY